MISFMIVPIALMAMLANGVQGQSFILPPRDDAVRLGGSASFSCVTDTHDRVVEWRHENDTIYNSDDGSVSDPDHYEVTRSGGSHQLDIKNIEARHAGNYTCSMVQEDVDDVFADLMALDVMECPEPGMGQEIVDAGDIKRLECSVGYHGWKAPSINWKTEDDAPADDVKHIFFHINKDNVTMYRDHVATADNENRVYTCVLQFANTPPFYTDECTTYFYVNHAVDKVEFEPEADENGLIVASVRDTITCKASGRPEADYVWYDADDQVVSTDSRLLIIDEMVGEHAYTCRANNTFQGQPRNATATVKITTGVSGAGSITPMLSSLMMTGILITLTALRL